MKNRSNVDAWRYSIICTLVTASLLAGCIVQPELSQPSEQASSSTIQSTTIEPTLNNDLAGKLEVNAVISVPIDCATKAISRDLQWLACQSSRSEMDGLNIINLKSDKSIRILPADGSQFEVSFSPDSKFMSVAHPGENPIMLFNVDQWETYTILREGKKAVTRISWSPTSQSLFATYLDGWQAVTIIQLDGEHKQLLDLRDVGSIKESPNFFPAWSPDGSKIAFMDVNEDAFAASLFWLSIIEIQTGEIVSTGIGPRGFYSGDPKWSPDGLNIAITSSPADITYKIFIYNIAEENLRQLVEVPISTHNEYIWSDDGKDIALCTFERGLMSINIVTGRAKSIYPNCDQLWGVTRDREVLFEIYGDRTKEDSVNTIYSVQLK